MKRLEESGLDEAIIRKILDQVENGEQETIIIVGGKPYRVSSQLEGNDPPDCTSDKCHQMREQIREVCEVNNWPLGYPVLVCDSVSGVCCRCYCYNCS